MLSALASPDRSPHGAGNGWVAARTILIDRSPASDLLLTTAHQPVWPIRDDMDYAAVSRACAARALAMTDEVGQVSPEIPMQSLGAVGALGTGQVSELARLYAHLTGRSYWSGPIADLPADAVVVTTFEMLTSDVLAGLYSDPARETAPGLICAADAARLRPQVLARAIYGLFPELDFDLPWTALFAFEDIEHRESPDLRILSAASPAAEVREALIAPSGLLAIATHSDGIDAMLAKSLVLCGINADRMAAPLDREPSCLTSNHCHRFDVPVAKVADLGATVAPDQIAARVMIFDTCFGTLAADAPINAERGLGRKLAENPGIGALATSWELTMLDSGKLQGLIAELRAGIGMGNAIARFNRSDIARRHAARLALFGDPLTRFAPRPATLTPAEQQRRPEAISATVPVANRGEFGFSHACLTRGMASLTAQLGSGSAETDAILQRQLAAARSAFELLCAFELKRGSDALDGDDTEPLRRALVQDAFVRRPFDDWKAVAGKAEWKHCSCGSCGAPSWVGVMDPGIPGASARRVVLCPRCNLSEDMPERVHINVLFDAATRSCRLVGKPPTHDWSAALIVRTRNVRHDRMWEWPSLENGAPVEHMPIPEALPAGPVRLGVVMAHDGWLAWTATDVHGGPGQ